MSRGRRSASFMPLGRSGAVTAVAFLVADLASALAAAFVGAFLGCLLTPADIRACGIRYCLAYIVRFCHGTLVRAFLDHTRNAIFVGGILPRPIRWHWIYLERRWRDEDRADRSSQRVASYGAQRSRPRQFARRVEMRISSGRTGQPGICTAVHHETPPHAGAARRQKRAPSVTQQLSTRPHLLGETCLSDRLPRVESTIFYASLLHLFVFCCLFHSARPFMSPQR